MPSRNFRDLVVWQRAMDLVELVYRMTQTLPKDELYGLSLQMRRSAVSIPSNVAEGQGRASAKEFCRFLRIAYGSLRELETQVLIAHRLNLCRPDAADELIDVASTVGRLLNGLMKSQEE